MIQSIFMIRMSKIMQDFHLRIDQTTVRPAVTMEIRSDGLGKRIRPIREGNSNGLKVEYDRFL
jgi:hypothetical protein